MLTSEDVRIMQAHFDTIEDAACAIRDHIQWLRGGRDGKKPTTADAIVSEGMDTPPHGNALHHRCLSLAHAIADERGWTRPETHHNDIDADVALLIYDAAWSGDRSQPEIAGHFGVTRNYVSKIKTGKVWADVTGHIGRPNSMITEDVARAIYMAAHQPDASQQEIAEEYGISDATVSGIKRRTRWASATEDLAYEGAA